MGLNRNINDDSTLAYLFNKTRQGASDALQKAIDAINATIATIQTALNNKVSKSGDTMTGKLILENSNFEIKDTNYSGGDTPSSAIGHRFSVVGKDGGHVGRLNGDILSDGSTRVAITATNGSYTNYLRLIQAADGTRSIVVNDAAPWRAALGAVNIGGDNMTGNLEIDKSNPSVFLKDTVADTSLNSDTTDRVWTFGARDKNNKYAAYWQSTFQTNGRINLVLSARRIVGGSNVDNNIILRINNDGTRSVSLSDAAPWRSALGLGSIATVASPVPIANGGTGQTEVTSTTTISQVATAASGVSITSVQYAQWGKLAQLNINVKATSAYASGNLLCTLVSGKRPFYTLTIMDNNGYHATFNTNGQVNVWHAYAANATFSVRCVYLLA